MVNDIFNLFGSPQDPVTYITQAAMDKRASQIKQLFDLKMRFEGVGAKGREFLHRNTDYHSLARNMKVITIQLVPDMNHVYSVRKNKKSK